MIRIPQKRRQSASWGELKSQTLNKEEIEKLAAPNDTAELIPIPEPFIVGQSFGETSVS